MSGETCIHDNPATGCPMCRDRTRAAALPMPVMAMDPGITTHQVVVILKGDRYEADPVVAREQARIWKRYEELKGALSFVAAAERAREEWLHNWLVCRAWPNRGKTT